VTRKKSSARRQWQKVEDRHAELHGAEKTKKVFPAMVKMGNTHGRNYPDWFDDFSAGESKSGIDLIPRWLWEAVDQAIENERSFSMDGDGKQRIPYVVLHSNGWKDDDDLVVMRDDVFRTFVLPAIFALGKVMSMSWNQSKAT
jgi:hypothetical protein